jgi:hypothetical protein
MMEAQVHMLISNLPISEARLAEIRSETNADSQMQSLRTVILHGWPEQRQDCPVQVEPYWNHRDEMTVIDDIIFKGEKIVIPRALRSQMLDKVHIGHMGIEKCKMRARDIIFWPGMGKDIETVVSKCSVCQERNMHNPKEPLIPHEIPTLPWEVVATDLFDHENSKYVLVVDYYSRYIEVARLQSTTSAAVIHKLKSIFARHGIPRKVVSDNGPQYSSAEFAQFSKDWGFVHDTSSPNYPSSNGLAEKCVQTVKNLLSKAQADKKDPYISLLEYRNTPLAENKLSPAQLLMSRRARSVLPCTDAQLAPSVVDHQYVIKCKQTAQQKQKFYHDRGSHDLIPLHEGETVRVDQYNKGKWKPAVVEKICDPNARSYVVRTEDGAQYRRNRRHLRHTQEDIRIPDTPCETNITLSPPQDTPQVQPYQAEPRNPQCSSDPPAKDPVSVAIPRTDTSQKDNSSHASPDPVYVTKSGRHVKARKVMDM